MALALDHAVWTGGCRGARSRRAKIRAVTLPAAYPFVGRGGELAILSDLLAAVEARRPRVVLLTGEPGIGKSRLLDEFVERVPERVLVLQGGCVDGPAVPFGPFAEAFRPLLRLADLPPGQRGLLLLVTDPERANAALQGDAQPTRQRLFESVLEILADSEAPTVLILDDMQWSDPSSAELARFIVRNLRRQRLLVLVVARDGVADKPGARDLLREVRRFRGLVPIPLAPYSLSAMAELMTAARGSPPGADEVADLLAASGGNAFFAEQLLSWDGEREGRLPPAVHELVGREVDTLADSARRAVELLVVNATPVHGAVLAAALPTGTAQAAVLELLDRRITVRRGPAIALRHSFYREAVLSRLDEADVRARHVDLAAAAEVVPDGMSVGEVAGHWLAAADPERALPALRRAAVSASTALAFPEAYALWSELVRVLENRPDEESTRRQLLDALSATGRAARWSGRYAVAAELVTRALSLTTPGDRSRRAVLHTQRARYRRLAGAVDEARWDADRAAALLADTDPDDLRGTVVLERARLLALAGEVESARALALEAVVLARAADDPALEGRALTTLGVAQTDADELAPALASLREAHQLCAAYGDFEDNIRACSNLSFVLLHGGLFLEGLAAATEAIELARRAEVADSGGAAGVAQCNAVSALVSLGRWDEAARRLAELLDAGTGDVIERAWLLGTGAQLHAATGRFDAAGAMLAELATLPRSDRAVRLGQAAAAAELAVWQHRPETALEVTLAELRADSPASDREYLLAWCLRAVADSADMARLRRDPAAESVLATRARGLVAAFGSDLFGHDEESARAHDDRQATLSRALLRAEFSRAVEGSTPRLWRDLADSARASCYERVYAEFRYAEALLDFGADPDDRAAAVRALTTAAAGARGIDAAPLLALANALAQRHSMHLGDGSAPNLQPSRSLLPQLTARERDVLALVKLGLTNRRIGRALGMSESTASVHVSNILAKLGVANRAAAAAVAQQLGL